MTVQTQSNNDIRSIYEKYGNARYGEKMSVISHSLQAALFAEKDGFEEYLIIAAFLHDIGHLLGDLNPEDTQDMGDFGLFDHEQIGATFLSKLGFDEKVCVPIANHVKAKRYLCGKDSTYLDNLSKASIKTLEYQGGPMEAELAKTFENEEYFEESIALRKVDDKAKIKYFNIDHVILDNYFIRVEKYLNHLRES